MAFSGEGSLLLATLIMGEPDRLLALGHGPDRVWPLLSRAAACGRMPAIRALAKEQPEVYAIDARETYHWALRLRALGEDPAIFRPSRSGWGWRRGSRSLPGSGGSAAPLRPPVKPSAGPRALTQAGGGDTSLPSNPPWLR